MPADPSTDLLLLTSASGKQASGLLPLLSNWTHLRLAVHTAPSAARLQQLYPRAEVIQTDLYSPTNTRALMKDVNVCIHIGPSYHPNEREIGTMMIEAAVAESTSDPAHFKHFIYSSVLNPTLSKMLNHDCKRHVEESLLESGLPYTILQPTTFMDNLPVTVLAAQKNPVFEASWSTANRFSMIALRDLAAAFHVVLMQRESHFFATYPLVSTRTPLSLSEAMAVVSAKIGREVKVKTKEYKAAVDSVLLRVYGKVEGVDVRRRDAAERMVLFYDGRGLVGNCNVLEWLVGREGVGFGEWVEGKLREGK